MNNVKDIEKPTLNMLKCVCQRNEAATQRVFSRLQMLKYALIGESDPNGPPTEAGATGLFWTIQESQRVTTACLSEIDSILGQLEHLLVSGVEDRIYETPIEIPNYRDPSFGNPFLR